MANNRDLPTTPNDSAACSSQSSTSSEQTVQHTITEGLPKLKDAGVAMRRKLFLNESIRQTNTKLLLAFGYVLFEPVRKAENEELGLDKLLIGKNKKTDIHSLISLAIISQDLYEAFQPVVRSRGTEILESELSLERNITAYEPYLTQVNLDKVLARDRPQAVALIENYVKCRNINASNNFGMTLLHTLIWADRPDLAKKVVESPSFKKINYKFCIPSNMGAMYASALDLAICFWRYNDYHISLEFIESLLMNGAIPTDPKKKFLDGEFVSEVYPFIILSDAAHPGVTNTRTADEFVSLFSLLYRYGFSVEEMENELRRRLFDTSTTSNNRAEEFSKQYDISIEKQKSLLDGFMLKLHTACKDLQKCEPIVEMEDEKLENGASTLKLTFDPSDRPCCIQ